MKLKFHTLDVFTERKFAGNPLAVVLDCDGLDDAAMQAIAREFNLSETVFVQSPRDTVNTAAIRIFTPDGELPFAGHPTVGTAVLLAQLRAPEAVSGGGVTIALEEKIGLVKVDVSRRPGRAARGVFGLPKLSERQNIAIDRQLAAKALGISPGDIGFGRHELSVWSAGVPFVMVPVASLDLVRATGIGDMQTWRAAFGVTGKGAAYVYSLETEEEGHHVHARMFSPIMGMNEDPATGAAAAAFSGAAVAYEQPGDGKHQLVIEQGYEMGRPSQIVLDLDIENGALISAHIGGGAVIVSEGVLDL